MWLLSLVVSAYRGVHDVQTQALLLLKGAVRSAGNVQNRQQNADGGVSGQNRFVRDIDGQVGPHVQLLQENDSS
jgi:hypothetical protein